ncbi:hypothetical protein GGH95_004243 [Coemansia sp. RSA 1836]|nr:hypothetical protein GGH95_004243 [Coemansia sp. RSA 1836]
MGFGPHKNVPTRVSGCSSPIDSKMSPKTGRPTYDFVPMDVSMTCLPNLSSAGASCGMRVSGISPVKYVRTSTMEPRPSSSKAISRSLNHSIVPMSRNTQKT